MRFGIRLLSAMKQIGTHDGKFHADEVLACFMLRQLPKWRDANVVRTRDPALLSKCAIVVDVGAEFEPKKNLFDHHQRSFQHTMHSLEKGSFKTKLSSAGLVYAFFGRKLISEVLAIEESNQRVDLLFPKLYEQFVEEIDAVDNGISQTDQTPRYAVTSTLSNRINNLNPAWNDQNTDEMAQFHKAMDLAGSEFTDRLRYYNDSWIPARESVQKAINDRQKVHSSGRILVFEQGGLPWKDHLFSLETGLDQSPPITYVIYPDNSGSWRLQCVPVNKLDSFSTRLCLPSVWHGVRGGALVEVTGIDGCIFCHATGFIAGNQTREGALAMALKSIEMQDK